MAEIEHSVIVEIVLVGDDEEDNNVIASRACSVVNNNRTVEEFRIFAIDGVYRPAAPDLELRR